MAFAPRAGPCPGVCVWNRKVNGVPTIKVRGREAQGGSERLEDAFPEEVEFQTLREGRGGQGVERHVCEPCQNLARRPSLGQAHCSEIFSETMAWRVQDS